MGEVRYREDYKQTILGFLSILSSTAPVSLDKHSSLNVYCTN